MTPRRLGRRFGDGTHREYTRTKGDKYLTPTSPRPTRRAMAVGNFGRNKHKRELREFISQFTRKQFQEMKRHEHRVSRREAQERPR